jgi:HAD superfamily hydrolase (TIGR01509 family)
MQQLERPIWSPHMSALFFGSISTVADTSELQRLAFNEAFRASGLDWNWDRESYREMLATSGGQERVSEYARSRGESVDASTVHSRKSEIFQTKLAEATVAARAGVVDTIRATKGKGWKLGLVTTTSSANVSALLDALSPDVQRQDFDVILDSASVENAKPDKAAYVLALHYLNETAGDCVAIEDNEDGVRSATSAGLACVAFPNENTIDGQFASAAQIVDHLDLATLHKLVRGQ